MLPKHGTLPKHTQFPGSWVGTEHYSKSALVCPWVRGPAYIKLGQALSIRPDILSPAAMTELQKLCDKVGVAAS